MILDKPRPSGHIFFVVLCVLAIPFGLFVGVVTLAVGFGLPDAQDWLDLGPTLAIFGVMTLFILAIVVCAVWLIIYRKTPNKSVSYTSWAIAFGALVIVNGFVLDGFVRRNMSNYRGGEVVRSYVDGFWHMLSQTDGLLYLLLFWPVVMFVGFLIARQRALASQKVIDQS